MADYRVSVDTKVNTQQLDKLEQRIKSFNNKPIKVKVDLNVDGSDITRQIDRQLGGKLGVRANLDIGIDDKGVNKAMSQAKGMVNKVMNTSKGTRFFPFEDPQYLNTLTNNIKKTVSKLSNNTKKAEKFISSYNSKSPINKLNEDIAKLDTVNGRIRSAKSELDSLAVRVPSWINEYKNTDDIDTFCQRIDRLQSAQIKANKAVSDALSLQRQRNTLTKKSNASLKLDNSKKTLGLQIDAWMSKNTAAIDEFGDRLNGIKARIADVNDDASLGALRSEFQQTTLEAQAMGKATMSIGDRLKQQAKEYGAYVGVAALTAAGAQALRMMGQNVLEVDTAMTGLYRVTDLTAQQYDKLYGDMISNAKEYGSTLTDTINATSDWVRAGFDADTALGLADITAMYQHISDLDYGEASKNLLTAYKGFEETFSADFGADSAGVLSSVEHVADAFNELDKYKLSIRNYIG